jgi:putative Mg2+ transporter-C (MgtC) family protein
MPEGYLANTSYFLVFQLVSDMDLTSLLMPDEAIMIGRLILSLFFGLMIGVERKGGRWGAGPRTFTLICMGSTLLTLVSIYGFDERSDPARVAAQIITGIGFIGAGVIWRSRTEIVHGITTAAAIWCSAAVGLSVGVGYFFLAAVATIMTILILSKGHPIETAKETLCIKKEHKVESSLDMI